MKGMEKKLKRLWRCSIKLELSVMPCEKTRSNGKISPKSSLFGAMAKLPNQSKRFLLKQVAHSLGKVAQQLPERCSTTLQRGRVTMVEELKTDRVSKLSLNNTLARLTKIWELEAKALDSVRFQSPIWAEQAALRDCASVYRKCAADLLNHLIIEPSQTLPTIYKSHE